MKASATVRKVIRQVKQHNLTLAVHGQGKCTADGSLRNKRPGLWGRPPCKGVAIGVATRGARRSGERTLRIPPSCSDPVSHAGGPHVASFVVGRPCARVRACVQAWRNALRVAIVRARACVRAYMRAWRNAQQVTRCRSASPSHEATVHGSW